MTRGSLTVAAAALALATLTEAHVPHRRYSGHFVERQDQYPTGPQYDVVPLDQIKPVSAEFDENTIADPPRKYNPGDKPEGIDNAPGLPEFNLGATAWPQDWNVPPDVNSDLVKEWLKELDGKTIPNIPRKKFAAGTNGIDCASNPDAIAKAGADGDCWWTCGGCLRPTDISTCENKMDWGLTFDDGPGLYTNKLLTYLDTIDTKATFFVVGPRVITRPEVVVYEYMTGHEIAIHGWSHSALTALTNEEIVSELGWTRYAIEQVIGVKPTMMRPPYGDIDDRVRAISHAMGLTPVIWTAIDNEQTGEQTQWDSNDWRVHGGGVPAVANQRTFEGILDSSNTVLDTGFITLQHDVYVEGVDLAIGATLPWARSHNPPFSLKPVMICQNRPLGDAYVETSSEETPEFDPSDTADASDPSFSPTTRSTTRTRTSTTESSTSSTENNQGGGSGAAGLKAPVFGVLVGVMGVVFGAFMV